VWQLWLVWRSGNGVGHINKKVKPRRARLVLGMVTTSGESTIPVLSRHSGPLSLAIPPWEGALSTGDGFATAGEETASSAQQ